MTRNLNGQAVVITGGAGGLGTAFGRAFGRAGARVALLDLSQPALDRATAELARDNVAAVGIVCDVTDEEQCRRAMEQAAGSLGGIDVLINNAGITHRSPFAETGLAVYRKVMEVNYLGGVACTKAALPWLVRRRGLVLVISSVAGFAPVLGRTGYAASKHALHGFFDSLRPELAGLGVAVCLVCPSFADTGIAHAALDGDGKLTRHPQSTVGKKQTPGQVAGAVLKAAQKQSRLTVLSPVGKASWWISRILPGLYEKMMARALASELRRG